MFFAFFFSAAKIGDGILLDHGTGVVIGETAVVGNRVSLMHVNSLSCLVAFARENSNCYLRLFVPCISVRSHIGWGGARSILYKGVETST